MKLITSLSIISLTCLSATAAESTIDKVTDGEIKYGLEGLTTWRSEYMYRGFKLADKSMEFQLAGQVALSNTETIDIGLYFGTATGDGDFTEAGAFIDFSKNIGDLTYTAKLTLRDYANTQLKSQFKSGADLGGSVNWVLNDTIDFTALLTYDTGAKGAYGEIKASAYQEVSNSSYLLFSTGVGATADYYDRSGLHHIFAKLEYTYNISDSVSLSPFVATSIAIHDEAENSLSGGVYFAVSF
ncbi:MAG: hypothetical protein ACSHX6_12650 [Akkermansiaceae bacterium]